MWNGNCYVSLVGFMFLHVKIKGMRIPWHTRFEEVNLRFYVKYFDGTVWKRGVVFIREIVPRRAITLVANLLYGENYHTLPMRHSWNEDAEKLTVEYEWKTAEWNRFAVTADKNAEDMKAGCEAEFVAEHYWGYTFINDLLTSEYEVVHPRWKCYDVKDYSVEVDFGQTYGEEFAFLSGQRPASVFLAEGSPISVQPGARIQKHEQENSMAI